MKLHLLVSTIILIMGMLLGCAQKDSAQKDTDIGRYQLYGIEASGTYIIFAIDTKTGITKEVVGATRDKRLNNVYGNQFGIPFPAMNAQPTYVSKE